MTVTLFAMIGMAVDDKSVPGIRDAIAAMAKRAVNGPYIIAFGQSPGDVYDVVQRELEMCEKPREGEMWQ